MTQKLDADELVTAARAATGLERFDSDSYREGLDVFLADINAGKPPQAALERIRGNVVQVLANRLKVTDYLEQRPGLLQRPVERLAFARIVSGLAMGMGKVAPQGPGLRISGGCLVKFLNGLIKMLVFSQCGGIC